MSEKQPPIEETQRMSSSEDVKKFFKDVLIVLLPIILFFAVISNISSVGAGLFSPFFLPFHNSLLLIIAASSFPFIFPIFIFGYIKFKTEKEVREHTYKFWRPFLYGFIGALILIAPALLSVYLFQSSIIVPSGISSSSIDEVRAVQISVVVENFIYLIFITVVGGFFGFFLHKTHGHPIIRKVIWFALVFSFGIFIFVLQIKYCIGFGGDLRVECVKNKAIAAKDPQLCLTLLGLDQERCVVEYSIVIHSSSPCFFVFKEESYSENFCYRKFFEKINFQNQDEFVCNDLCKSENITAEENKNCYTACQNNLLKLKNQ